MATSLTVKSPLGTEITLQEKNIENIELISVTPEDSAARSSSQRIMLKISGKFANNIAGGDEPIKDLYQWSLVSGQKNDAYRSVQALCANESVVLRNYELPKAYVQDFDADFDAQMGNWHIVLAQKEDQLKDVKITGAYGLEG